MGNPFGLRKYTAGKSCEAVGEQRASPRQTADDDGWLPRAQGHSPTVDARGGMEAAHCPATISSIPSWYAIRGRRADASRLVVGSAPTWCAVVRFLRKPEAFEGECVDGHDDAGS